MWTRVRLFLEDQSDPVLHCLFSRSRRLYAYAHVMNYFSVILDSVDPDQTDPIDEQSDLVLHCLLYLYAFKESADYMQL